jgi:acetyl-CoA carboxylase carboxyl transferase subunit alpha
VIIGVGGSGGAIAVATASRVLMLEHAFYSVISPEGAASILWRDTAKAQEAATSMKITAQDLARSTTITSTGEAIANALDELKVLDRDAIRQQRRDKFLAIGRTIA